MLSTIILTAATIVIFAPYFTNLFFGKESLISASLMRWLAISIILSSLVTLFSGILNGYRIIGKLTFTQGKTL